MIFQARQDGSLDFSGNNEGGGKKTDLGYSWKREPTGFATRSPSQVQGL